MDLSGWHLLGYIAVGFAYVTGDWYHCCPCTLCECLHDDGFVLQNQQCVLGGVLYVVFASGSISKIHTHLLFP